MKKTSEMTFTEYNAKICPRFRPWLKWAFRNRNSENVMIWHFASHLLNGIHPHSKWAADTAISLSRHFRRELKNQSVNK